MNLSKKFSNFSWVICCNQTFLRGDGFVVCLGPIYFWRHFYPDFTVILFLTSKLLKTSLSCSGTLWSTRRVKHLWVISPNELWGLVSIYLKSIFPQISRQEIQSSSRGVKTTFKFGEYSVTFTFKKLKTTLCLHQFCLQLDKDETLRKM